MVVIILGGISSWQFIVAALHIAIFIAIAIAIAISIVLGCSICHVVGGRDVSMCIRMHLIVGRGCRGRSFRHVNNGIQ